MKKKVLHISSFLQSSTRHGGTRRSEQILEMLEERDDVDLIVLSNAISWQENVSKYKSIWICLFSVSKIISSAFKHFVARRLTLRGVYRYIFYGYPVICCINSEKIDLIVLEVVKGTSMVVADIVRISELPYIVVPHNVEFLVHGQSDNSFFSPGDAFDWEVNIYRGAKQILAISEFDAAILRCFDINVDFLPYYPSKSFFDNIEIFRKHREISIKDFYLVFGTVYNVPTRIGIERLLIQIIKSVDWKKKVIVAGYGSEVLVAYKNENIDVRGSISDSNLNKLLESTLGVIIQQPQTTGFMTRLTELNLLQVPVYVVGHYEQAKLLDDYGIHLVKSIDEILENKRVPILKYFQRPSLKHLISR